MSRGYLLFALNTDNVDYVKLAYACALSIKITQPDGFNSVALVTHNAEEIKSQFSVFDHVIEYTGPTGMDGRSRGYDYSPYEETIMLDSDMLLLSAVDHHWDIMKDRDLFISTCPKTYRGDRFKYGFYREVFEEHQLPDVYSAWTYFKKSPTAEEFFDTVKLMTDEPENFIKIMLPYSSQKTLPTDDAFALALIMLDLESSAICEHWDFPSITHMKARSQGWHTQNNEWTDKIRFTMDEDASVKIGVWHQQGILHYVNKNLITGSIIKILEEVYGN